jgi:hypothetical protein
VLGLSRAFSTPQTRSEFVLEAEERVNILRFRGMDDAKSVNCFSERLDSSKVFVADVLLLSVVCSRSSAEGDTFKVVSRPLV